MSLFEDEINVLQEDNPADNEAANTVSPEEAAVPAPTDEQPSDLDTLLAQYNAITADDYEDAPTHENLSDYGKKLTPDEIDVLGEIGNIGMGAVATTMYTLLDRRVSITTPRVSVHSAREVLATYKIPFVVVRVEFVEGLEGSNLLVLRVDDTAKITSLLMADVLPIEEPIVLTEMHLSAISEIMNQMMGSSATALSKLLGAPVNISPPMSANVGEYNDVSGLLDGSDIVVKIGFDMEIDGLLKSELLQLLPYDLSVDLAKKFMDFAMGVTPAASGRATQQPAQPSYSQPAPQGGNPQYMSNPPQSQYPQYPQSQYVQNVMAPPEPVPVPGNLVDVHRMQYQSFDGTPSTSGPSKAIDLIHDIPLQVSVELGKTKKEISEILEFSTGTIIVLDKVADDPVEIVVNGKLIARGEVVVIDENYGVRITEIINN